MAGSCVRLRFSGAGLRQPRPKQAGLTVNLHRADSLHISLTHLLCWGTLSSGLGVLESVSLGTTSSGLLAWRGPEVPLGPAVLDEVCWAGGELLRCWQLGVLRG